MTDHTTAPTLRPIVAKIIKDTVADDDFSVIEDKFSAPAAEGVTITYNVATAQETMGADVYTEIDDNGITAFTSTHKATGNYGTLYYDEASGDYRYVPNDDNINAVGTDGASDTFSVTASNGTHTSTSQTLTITIEGADDAPTFKELVGDFAIAENDNRIGNPKTIGGPVKATDPENVATVTYELVSAPVGFAIDENGQITYAGPALNREAPNGARVTLTVKATAGGLSSTQAVTIEVTNVNEAPEFGNARTDLEIDENKRGIEDPVDVVTITTFDPEDGTTGVKYNLVNAHSGFVIGTTTGQITYEGTGLDHETTETITLTVRASDGELSATQRVTISVKDIDEAPEFNELTGDFTIAENDDRSSSPKTLGNRVQARDPEREAEVTYKLVDKPAGFKISDKGQITYEGTGLDYETTPTITLTVQATAGGLSSTQDVIITVTDVSEISITGENSAELIEDSRRFNTAEGKIGLDDAPTSADFSLSVQAGSSTATPISANETSITGTYGVLVVNQDGTYTYIVNNNDPDTNALGSNQTGTDAFTFSYTNNTGSTLTDTLDITVKGRTDYTTTNSNFSQSSTEADLTVHHSGRGTIQTGSGDDIIIRTHTSSGSVSTYAGQGNDEIHGGRGTDGIYGQDGEDYIDGGRGADILYGGGDNDILYGNNGTDILYGDTGNDYLYGGKGNDSLFGNSENDYLSGDIGNDTLSGDTGDDYLIGGLGRDILIGGTGSDEFVLALTNTSIVDLDIVTDFTSGDKIEIDTPTGTETALASPNSLANIRWTQDSDYSTVSGITAHRTNARSIDDTIIYHTKGTSQTSDDVVLMVLEDYTTALTFADFKVVKAGATNEKPTFVTIPTDLTLAENVGGSPISPVNIGSPVTARDPAGGTVTYGLLNAPSNFAIDSATGQIRYTGSAFNYETLTDAQRSILLNITASTTNGSDTKTTQQFLIIAVTDVDEPPEFKTPPTDLTLDENVGGSSTSPVDIGSRFRATDPEGHTVTYSLSGAPSGFTINSLGQIRYTGSGLDYETAQSVSLTVVASSSGGEAEQTVTISVTDVPEISVTGGTRGSASLPLIENSRLFDTAEGQIALQNTLSGATYSLSVQVGSGTKTDIEADDTSIIGVYGTLTVDQNGTWEYTVNNLDPDTNGLNSRDTGTETFTFSYKDGDQTLTHTLTVTIEGRTDYTSFSHSATVADLAVYSSGRGIVRTGSGDDIIIRIHTPSDVVSTYGGSGNDEIYGGAGRDVIYGQDGNDYIDGGDGFNRFLSGGNGNDNIYGGNGHDIISGDGGNDALYGGKGNDEIYGGAGNDVFILALTNTQTSDLDIVADFARGDKIEAGTASSTETTLDDLKSAAKIRWTQDSDYSTVSGITALSYGDRNIHDTIIYHIQNTPNDKTDDIVLMVLVDYTAPLAINDFVDEKPTVVTLSSASDLVLSGTSTRTKLADIDIADDGFGTNTLNLTAGGTYFEIVQDDNGDYALYLKAGQTLTLAANHTARIALTATGIGTPAPIEYNLTVISPSIIGKNSAQLIEDSRHFDTAEGQAKLYAPTGTTYNLSVQRSGGTKTSISTDNKQIAGTYGTLEVDRDGTWEYTVNNSDADTNRLNSGQTGTETFTFTYTGGSQTFTHTLTVTIKGRTDYTPTGYLNQSSSTQNLAVHVSGTQRIDTGSGDDIIIRTHTSSYWVQTNAGSGNDEIYGGRGRDNILGYYGIDYIYGGDGNDQLGGNQGDDYLYGGAGDDFLGGGTDDDYLDGGFGRDTLSGKIGNDIFVLGLINTQTSDLDIVTDFARGDKIGVNTADGIETTLAALKRAIDIRWTQDSDYNTTLSTNNRNTNDTIIYHTRGTVRTSDDVVLMVLEDYNTTLTIADFKVAVRNPPVFTTIPNNLRITENRDGSSTAINIGSRFRATDPENHYVSYSLSDAPSGFEIDSATGQIRYTGSGLNYEALRYTRNSIELTVVASSGGGQAEQDVRVYVTNVDEPPRFTRVPSSLSIAENRGGGVDIGSRFRATDPEGHTVAYSLSGAPSGFTINSLGQIRYTGSGFNYEALTPAQRSIEMTVVATSSGGRAEGDVTIYVRNVNEPPVFTTIPRNLTIAENRDGSSTAINIGSKIRATDPDHTITYSLKSAPAGFKIVSTSTGGQIQYTGSGLDYETARTIPLTVVASSGGHRIERSVTVNVTDVPEISVTGKDSVRLIEDSRRFNSAEGQIEVDAVAGTTYSLSVRSGSTTTPISADNKRITGTYGTLEVDRDGTWEYTVNNADADTNRLNSGQTGTETFTFSYAGGGRTVTHNLDIAIEGRTDYTVTTSTTARFNQSSATADLAVYVSYIFTWYWTSSTEGPVTATTGSGNDIIILSLIYYIPGYVYAGSGNDEIYGSAGGDYLYGQNDNDYIKGGGGNDKLYGGNGHDYLYGGDGNDFLGGNSGNDYLYGDDGNDTLDGDHGNDVLYGGDGNDYLDGDEDNDKVYGGDGDDRLYGQHGNDYLKGEKHQDRLYGGSGNDFLDGDGGNDYLYGGSGNDSLYGDSGNDYLSGGLGRDILVGGTGNDDFYLYLTKTRSSDLDIVTDFASGDEVKVNIDSWIATTQAKLMSAAKIRWTKDTDYSSLSGVTAHSTNNRSINDTIIYGTRGTATTNDDIVLMVLEDYTAFGFDDFALNPFFWGGGNFN